MYVELWFKSKAKFLLIVNDLISQTRSNSSMSYYFSHIKVLLKTSSDCLLTIKSVQGLHRFKVTVWEDATVFLHTNWELKVCSSGFWLQTVKRLPAGYLNSYNSNLMSFFFFCIDKKFSLLTRVTEHLKWEEILKPTWLFESLMTLLEKRSCKCRNSPGSLEPPTETLVAVGV